MTDAFRRLESILSGCEALVEDLLLSIESLKKTLQVVEDALEDIKYETYKQCRCEEDKETDEGV